MINDFYQDYTECSASIIFKNESGKVLKNENYTIGNVSENSAKKFVDVSANVFNKVDGKVFVDLALEDKSGNLISSNDYFFLIGDQAKASAQFKEMGKSLVEKNGKYTYGNYFRFFDEMTRENGQDYESGSVKPKAQGFEKE